jgi:hypothetical protein
MIIKVEFNSEKHQMKSLRKTMVYVAGVVTGVGALAVGGSFAVDSAVPYTFEDGQVISADVMNDIFGKLKNTTVGFENTNELVGTWACTQYDVPAGPGGGTAGFPSANFTLNATTGIYEGTSTWTFAASGANTTLSTTNFLVGGMLSTANNTGTCASNTGNTHYDYSVYLAEGYLLLGSKVLLAGCTSTATALQIQKVSPYKFKFPTGTGFGICVKQNQPPAIPSGLTISGGALNWTDNSSDETAFIVMKKSPGGAWTDLATISANTTTYTDSSASTGDKYRVRSQNNNGNSLGSNVVRIQ